jgi:RND family efflux transporter MFP subunit
MIRRQLMLLLAMTLPANAADEGGRAVPRLTIDSALVTVIEQVEVPARVEGVLASLDVREGQIVAEGDALGRIEDSEPLLTLKRASIEYEIAGRQARSELRTRIARKAAEVADVEYKRAKESIEKYKKSVSGTELDRLRLAAEKAALDVEQTLHDQEVAELTAQLKQAELQLAQAAVDRRRISAPLPGMIVQINHRPGEWVQPGKTVLRLLRVDKLRVEGLVNVRKLEGDVTGRRVTLSVALGGDAATEFPGAIVFVSPEVNPVNGQVRVWAEVENRDLLLRPGMQGALTVHLEPARAAK